MIEGNKAESGCKRPQYRTQSNLQNFLTLLVVVQYNVSAIRVMNKRTNKGTWFEFEKILEPLYRNCFFVILLLERKEEFSFYFIYKNRVDKGQMLQIENSLQTLTSYTSTYRKLFRQCISRSLRCHSQLVGQRRQILSKEWAYGYTINGCGLWK